jgi:hypothetical protein
MLILMGYALSFSYDNYETCQNSMPGLVILTSMIPFFIIDPVYRSLPDLAETLHFVFSVIFPGYNLWGGLYFIIQFPSKTTIVGRDFLLSDILSDFTIAISFGMILVWIVIFAGKFHDQGDAKRIIMGQLRRHNDTPLGRPTALGRI